MSGMQVLSASTVVPLSALNTPVPLLHLCWHTLHLSGLALPYLVLWEGTLGDEVGPQQDHLALVCRVCKLLHAKHIPAEGQA
jgi:hypothetical protein